MRYTIAVLAATLLAALAQGGATHSMARRIRIEKTQPGEVGFGPSGIVVWAGDQIHWYNDTAVPHEPGVLRSDGTFVAFLEAPVVPGALSAVFSPLARIDDAKNMIPFTIPYLCGLHRNEQGVIQVIPTP